MHGLVRRRHRKLNTGVEMLGVMLAKVIVAVKTLDLGRHLDGKCIGIKVRDRTDATRSGAHAAQVASAVLPSGDTAPMPVIATLCSIMVSSSKPLTRLAFYIAIPPSTRMTSPVM